MILLLCFLLVCSVACVTHGCVCAVFIWCNYLVFVSMLLMLNNEIMQILYICCVANAYVCLVVCLYEICTRNGFVYGICCRFSCFVARTNDVLTQCSVAGIIFQSEPTWYSNGASNVFTFAEILRFHSSFLLVFSSLSYPLLALSIALCCTWNTAMYSSYKTILALINQLNCKMTPRWTAEINVFKWSNSK